MNVTLRQIVITYHLFILSIFYNTAVSYFLMCVIVQIEELNIVKHIDDTNTLGEAINLHQCSVAGLNGFYSKFE